MTDTNINPSAPPAPAGQPAGGAPQGTPIPPAAGNQPPGGDNGGAQPKTYTDAEIRAIEAKAKRWDAHTRRSREDRRENRRSTSSYDADSTPPEVLDALRDRDQKIEELSSVRIKLEVKDKVRDLLDGDEYKDLPAAIKRAVVRNPLGFANSGAQTVEDAIADIQDYLDDELDSNASQAPAQGGGQVNASALPANIPPAQAPGVQTPPASGSGPNSPTVSPTDGTEGKFGRDRSTTVLQNILKGARR